MIVYSTSIATQEHNLIDLGAPETLGGKVLEGTPKIERTDRLSKKWHNSRYL